MLGERNEGFMQMTYVSGDIKHDLRHYEELAEISGAFEAGWEKKAARERS